MIRRAFVFAALVLVFGLACPPTWAQGSSSQPAIFTYVAEWNTPRAQWADIAKVEASTKPTMDALVADGTLLGYGTYENRIHSEASPTHGSWFQAESLANIFKALDKIYAQAGATTDPAQAAAKKSCQLSLGTRLCHAFLMTSVPPSEPVAGELLFCP